MIKKFISYYKPYKKLFILDLIVATIATICSLIYPMMTRVLINETIPNKEIKVIGIFAIILMLLYLIKAGCCYFMQYFGHLVGVGMQADMRRDMFNHLEELPNSYFDNNRTGDLMSRMINDLMEISELAHHGPEDLFISIVMFLGSFIILSTINIPLTILVFAFVPFIVIFTLKKRKKMNDCFMETRVHTSNINSTLENSIAGIRISKAFVAHEYEKEKFNKGNNKFREVRKKAYKVMAEYFAGVNFGVDILDYVVLIAGGVFTYYGLINLGDFLAYMLYVKLFTDPIKKLINFVEQYQNGMTGFKRFMEIMNVEKEKENPNAVEINNV